MSTPARFAGVGVFVTGASRGLGRDIAVAFAREGAHVTGTYRTHLKEATETLRRIEAEGGTGAMLAVDVRRSDEVRDAVSAAEAAGPIQVLVNNAARVQDAPFIMVSAHEWTDTVSTNLTGTYHCCRAVLPRMMAREQGAVINVASVAALRASPGQTAYAATKAAVLGLTRTLATEVAGRGVRVNAIVPGLLSTGMGLRLDRRVAERRLEQIPLGRFGGGDEVARAVLFLASDEASYIVGEAITVDGGLSL